jgi:hypothetical protein
VPAGCCVASHHAAVLPLVAPPTCPCFAPASCRIASCHPLVALPLLLSCPASWLLHCLSLSSCCAALPLSHRTSWFLHRLLSSSCCAALSSSHCAGWLLRHLLMHRPLVLLLRCSLILSAHQLIVVSPLVILLLCHPLVLSLCRMVVALSLLASPSRPLIALAGCCVISPCATLLSSRCAALSPHRLVVALPPSNAAAAIKRHQMPPPPPPLPLPLPLLPLPLLTAIFAAAPLSIAKERGSSSTTTSMPTAAPT